MAEPYCLAMVLCDGVHRDAATGKSTILGTFSALGAKEFPARVLFWVYFAVTDALGPTTLRLRIVDASSGIANGSGEDASMVPEASWDHDFEDPLMVLEVGAQIDTVLPKPGLYHCELWARNDLLMSRRLLAVQGPTEQEKGEGESHG